MGNLIFLERKSFRGVSRLLCWEAGLAVAYETWMTPSFLSGLAGQLKVSMPLVTLLMAIPWIGATGQILGAYTFENCTSVKRYVLGVAGVGRFLWTVPLFFAGFWGWKSYYQQIPFPMSAWFLMASLCACFSSLLTSASTNGWMYWMQALVPKKFQGRFFGLRKRFTTVAFIVASFLGALTLDWVHEGYRLGALLIGILALLCGGISLFMHSKVENVPFLHSNSLKRPRSLKEILKAPLEDREFRKILLFGTLFNGTVQLAGPFLPYYFTSQLHVSLGTISWWSGIANVGCFLTAIYWGKKADQCRSPFDVLWVTGLLISLVPLIYLVKTPSLIKILAPCEHFIGGLAWSGFMIAQTKLLLKVSPPHQGASYFSVFAAACGISGAFFTFVGGQILQQFPVREGFDILWISSMAARMAVLWFFCRPLLSGHNNRRDGRKFYSTFFNLPDFVVIQRPDPGQGDGGLVTPAHTADPSFHPSLLSEPK